MKRKPEYEAILPRKGCMFSLRRNRATTIAFFKMRKLLLKLVNSTDKHNHEVLQSERINTNEQK
jgi:hypothetical protein